MILCCGEALIDMIPRAAAGEGLAFEPHPGGAVFNTARAIGRLQQPVGFFSGLSSDLFGRLLIEDLKNSQVSTAFMVTSDRPTTLAFVHLVNGQAHYVFYDENTAGRLLWVSDLDSLT
jgi:fructokinase